MLVNKIIKFNKTTFLSRCYSAFLHNHSEVFSKYFGFTSTETHDYIKMHRLSKTDPEHLDKIIQYCREIGFSYDNILLNPLLLTTNPITLENRYNVMQEGGLNITPYVLSKFRTFYNRKIEELKELEILPSDNDLIQNFTRCLDTVPESLKYMETEESTTLAKAHFAVLKAYLMWRLQYTEEDINYLRRVHIGIHRKSFRFLVENIAIAEELGFTPKKMLKYGYILHNYPKYTKSLLEKYPTLVGYDIRKAFRQYPKLLTISPESIEKILNILKESNISDEAIQKRLNIFQLSPETVKARLDELRTDNELRLFIHNPNILKLVVHHTRAKSRMSFLKKLQLKCSSVTLLGNDVVKFDIHVKGGRDVNTQIDIFSFLKSLFKLESTDFESSLKKHRNYLNVPLVSMEATFNHLIAEKFEPVNIAKVASILLYPSNKIHKAHGQALAFQKERRIHFDQVQILNLILYFIEREYHFTGNGIWAARDEEGTKSV